MSRLKDRLQGLRRQAGGDGSPAAAPPLPLAERIQRSRASRGPGRPTDEDVAELLGAEPLAPGVVVADRYLPLDSVHGTEPLAGITGYAGIDEPHHMPAEDFLFMDTETTGLSGGTGTLIFLLGLARLKGEALHVRQYFLTGFEGEAAMLRHAGEWLAGARALVTYNGKCFDAPLAATRYRLAGLPDPFAPLEHLDLLYPVRRAFAERWPDCCLKTAEQRLVGFQRVDDLPGHEAPEAWFEFVRFGRTKRLSGLLEHNYWDVVTSAALLPALQRVYANPVEAQANLRGIARHRLRQGDAQLAFSLLQENSHTLDHKGRLELATLYRRMGQWEAAAEIWQTLAEEGCSESLERLAKYHEHIRRDPATALVFTQRLLESSTDPRHERRRRRLQIKLR